MPRKKRPGRGRGRPSTIDQLPEDLRVELNAALRDRRLTQREIVEHLNGLLQERGLGTVSRSAVNRYAVQIEEKGGLLREAREAANAIVGRIEEAGGADVGRAVTELVKSLTFDIVVKANSEGDDRVSLDTLKQLATISERIERASKLGLDRELKIIERVEAETKQAAAKAVENVGREKGLTEETVKAIKAKVLGVRVERRDR